MLGGGIFHCWDPTFCSFYSEKAAKEKKIPYNCLIKIFCVFPPVLNFSSSVTNEKYRQVTLQFTDTQGVAFRRSIFLTAFRFVGQHTGMVTSATRRVKREKMAFYIGDQCVDSGLIQRWALAIFSVVRFRWSAI
jgi:hypothetical protein